MEVRYTQKILYGDIINALHRNLQGVFKYQQKLTSGLDFSRPSESPFKAMRALSLRSDEVRFDRYENNLAEASNFLESSSSVLQELSSMLTNIRALAIQGSNGHTNEGDRKELGNRIDGLLDDVMRSANSSLGGSYIFAGTRTSQIPFVLGGNRESTTYFGDGEEIRVEIGPNSFLPLNLSGARVFMQQDRGATTLQGNTGISASGGHDTGIGNDTLLVRHTTTTYGDGALGGSGDSLSGIRPGAGSAGGDTILGLTGQHTLTLDAVAGTVSLDGGEAVSFDPLTDSNLAVTNEDGDVVFLDLTGVTPGFSGVVDITANGEVSLDEGNTWKAIDFSADQILKDSETGAVLHLDTSGAIRTGDAYVTYTGTFDLFQTLIGLRDDLFNERGLSQSEQTESILQRLSEFDRVHNNVINSLQEGGGRLESIDLAETHNQDMMFTVQKLLSNAQDTDIAEAISMYTQQTNLYQQILGVGGRVVQQSLLNFI